jgi:hypothetical protein
MSDGAATGPDQACKRDRLSQPVDVVAQVVRTHMAPVTGLEEEVARILFERPGWMTNDSEDCEGG